MADPGVGGSAVMVFRQDRGRPKPSYLPRALDVTTPSAARVYDWYLGGGANFEIDRAFGAKAVELLPNIKEAALSNRHFLQRAVRFARGQGISQFVDLGSGVSRLGNVHQTADELGDAVSRVVYVDNEPVAVAHSEILLDNSGDRNRHQVVNADLRDPRYLWSRVLDTGVIDLTQPIVLLGVAVLHFISPRDRPAELMATYRCLLPPGSLLVLSHMTVEGVRPERVAQAERFRKAYEKTSNPAFYRGRDEFTSFFGDFAPVDPGVTWASLWRPADPVDGDQSDLMFLVGVAEKPS